MKKRTFHHHIVWPYATALHMGEKACCYNLLLIEQCLRISFQKTLVLLYCYPLDVREHVPLLSVMKRKNCLDKLKSFILKFLTCQQDAELSEQFGSVLKRGPSLIY